MRLGSEQLPKALCTVHPEAPGVYILANQQLLMHTTKAGRVFKCML